MQKINVYILVDCSGSMSGTPLSQASAFVEGLLQALRNNSASCQSEASVIAYNMEIKEVVSMTSLTSIQFNSLNLECAGPKNLGLALSLVNKSQEENKVIFIITKGKPSDVQLYNEQARLCKTANNNIVVLHGNIEKSGDAYNNLTDKILPWKNVNLQEIVKSIFGGNEIASADGRAYLQDLPKVIDIQI